MDRIVLTGGRQLKGEVTVSGAKNAAVAILPATILVNGVCRIENIPRINDVALDIDILYHLGADIRYINDTCVEIDARNIKLATVPSDLARKMRASYYMLGALLSRFHQAQVDLPGGCNFGGVRPIDQHIKAFEALGAEISVTHGIVYAKAEKLVGSTIYFDVVSVGATINAMLAATLAEGNTVIESAAKEPHIVDLANFLNSMGANIMGAGTDVIKVTGVKELHGGEYAIIPDQIEAGTFMIAAAATHGEVLVKNVIPKHMESLSAKLIEAGAEICEFDDSILVKCDGGLSRANVKTSPYPGFPTDLQPQMCALLSVARGKSTISESVWDNRFKYVNELRRMGADITVDSKVAMVEGGSLTGAVVKACDLRAGAAMIIAGLAATGTTTIEDIDHIERGYEDITGKFASLGADIHKVLSTQGKASIKIG